MVYLSDIYVNNMTLNVTLDAYHHALTKVFLNDGYPHVKFFEPSIVYQNERRDIFDVSHF